ncbi:MAG: MATE family efflux transporter [Anaerolineales bacterium]|nr:MATE family efflux transporter [Anaerolineales bacterium]
MNKLSLLTRASLLLFFLFGLDKALAFGRLFIVSRTFSLPFQDAFNAANNLPDLLFALISGGAFSMAFIPLLRQTLTLRGREQAWDLFSRVANLMFVVTGVAAVLVAVFARQIVSAEVGIVPGFGPEQQALVADLMRLNLISLMIFSLSGLVMGGLQANQHFLLPALAPFFYNVGQIAGAIFFAPLQPIQIGTINLPTLGMGVHGLVYGAILGAALHLLIQIPGLIKYQFRWTASLDVRNSGLIEALKLMAPRLLTMLGIQLMFLARDNLASRLDQEGAVSALTYGWMIMQVPETLLGTAIATALLPSLAEFAGKGEWKTFSETLEKALRVLLALTLPVAAVAMAGLRPLIAAAFGLDETGTILLTATSRMYLLTLTGYALQETLARAFYARKEPLVPLYGILLRLAVYLTIGIAAVTLFRAFGPVVIAAAELSLAVEALFLLFLLNRRLEQRVQLSGALVRGTLAALLGGVCAYALALYLPGAAIPTALVGMAAGGLLSLALIWSEFRLLFRL